MLSKSSIYGKPDDYLFLGKKTSEETPDSVDFPKRTVPAKGN